MRQILSTLHCTQASGTCLSEQKEVLQQAVAISLIAMLWRAGCIPHAAGAQDPTLWPARICGGCWCRRGTLCPAAACVYGSPTHCHWVCLPARGGFQPLDLQDLLLSSLMTCLLLLKSDRLLVDRQNTLSRGDLGCSPSFMINCLLLSIAGA